MLLHVTNNYFHAHVDETLFSRPFNPFFFADRFIKIYLFAEQPTILLPRVVLRARDVVLRPRGPLSCVITSVCVLIKR